ncbi:MAG: glycosyltransferase family 25 protein [Gammaproteobacteria bacterium]|nr:glycosyltransferase family 25 protein [Gammaproteobacteria bacterium]
MPEFTSGERLANTATHWHYLRELNSSEVGCYLSHFRAIRSAYEAGLDRICILEDDVQLEESFGSVLAELEQLPTEVEIVRLMGLLIRKRKVVQALSDDIHKLVRPKRGWSGGLPSESSGNEENLG